MPYGWPLNPYNTPKGTQDDPFTDYITTIGKDPGGGAPTAPPWIPRGPGAGDYGGGGGGTHGGDSPFPPTVPDLGHIPPINDVINEPPNPDLNDPRSNWQRWKDNMLQALKNFKFDMGGIGISQLLEWFLKGYTIVEVLDELNNGDDKKPPTGGGPGGGGGGGGGGKGGGFTGPSSVGAYQGLQHKPSFLSWQPTNAGAPMFSAGGPSSLSGSPPPPPPPPVKKPKKGKG